MKYMELRWFKKTTCVDEHHFTTTVLQYRIFGDHWSDWMDVPTVKE